MEVVVEGSVVAGDRGCEGAASAEGAPHRAGTRLPPGRSRTEPLIILAAPRSFSSVVAAMLGQHPELYALPETQLFSASTVAEWFARSAGAAFPMQDGLLRAIAELMFGAQTERTIVLASHWLRARPDWSTIAIFNLLAARVAPRAVVEKSPMIAYEVGAMSRIYRAFPHASFVHLLRHPAGFGQSVLKHIRESSAEGRIPEWLARLASYESTSDNRGRRPNPQVSWLTLQRNIITFLRDVPEAQKIAVRGEDILAAPDATLVRIAEWRGLRSDAVAIDAMLHPERSPFAHLGPPRGRYGNDVYFLRSPQLRPARGRHYRLTDPLPWRDDGTPFAAEIVDLARSFGYD